MTASETTLNPLLEEWSGPGGGVPPFDRIRVDDFEPAFEAAMAEHLREIEAIAADPGAPGFENTMVALERAGDALDQVTACFGIWRSNLSTPELREAEGRLAPKLSEHRSKIIQNEALFHRVAAVRAAVQDSPDGAGLRPDQRRLVELTYDSFARNGATLTGAAKARYAAIEQRLAALHTRFGQNVLADEERYVTYLDRGQLAGLPESFVAAAAAAATERGQEGRYAVLNTRSAVEPFLTYSERRDLREQVWRTFYDRGDNGDENDNNRLIAEILALRDERVKLLGYENYAAWRLSDRMAKTPDRAMALLEAVWQPALGRVAEEAAAMQQVADQEAPGGAAAPLAPWDYRYYAEKVRKARYDLDSDAVKQYLQLDKLREAMFFVAGELFGYAFTAVPEGSVPVFHPDVRVWQVTDRASGRLVGLWYLDPFARSGKRSGAWASTYRGYESFDGERTVLVSNNSNFIQGAPGEPVLVSWQDAETFFHEFGHALHALSSAVAYPTLNRGVRDYTEFQSQLLERWLLTAPVIKGYLVHHRTGEPIPDPLVAKIRQAETFNQGFQTAEYLASALVDMAFHTVDPTALDPGGFERETLARLGMPAYVAMRHRSPHFGHIFSGEGYSAGYYGYLWADVLTSDAAQAFAEAPGGFYDRDLAAKLVEHLFAAGNAVDPADAYRAFRGRDARIDALMRDRGFPAADTERSGGTPAGR
jgi:peptidyl-dipeptidase Dcp